MEQINKKSAHFDEELDLVNGIMKHMKLPEKMQDDVVDFMFHVQTSPDMHHDLENFFSILNDPLRKQILYHLYSSIIHKVELFQKCSSVEQSFFITRFKSVLFMPGNQICKEGERGDKLYFINKGCVAISISQKIKKLNKAMRGDASYINSNKSNQLKQDEDENMDESIQNEDEKVLYEKNEILLNELNEGSVFGEIALFTKLKRTASVVAKGPQVSNCAYLTREDVELIESNFPHIAKQFRNRINDYQNDENMKFRRAMIRNLHYFRDLNDEIINAIMCKLDVKRYAKGQIILKNGDTSDRIMFLRLGEINV